MEMTLDARTRIRNEPRCRHTDTRVSIQQIQLMPFMGAMEIENQFVIPFIAEIERHDIRKRLVIHTQIDCIHLVEHRANRRFIRHLTFLLAHNLRLPFFVQNEMAHYNTAGRPPQAVVFFI